jgi:hypothetical protein
MLSRNATTNLTRRQSSMRRLRRRNAAASMLYCHTNGCASFLVPDPASGVASCPICGYSRRLPRAN